MIKTDELHFILYRRKFSRGRRKDNIGKDRLEKDGLDYIKLGNLLQKHRTPEAGAVVEKIIASILSLEDKIGEIEKIDNELKPLTERFWGTEKGDRPDKPEKPARHRKSTELFYKQNLDHNRRNITAAAHNRQKIRIEPLQAGFVDYILKERPKFSGFARESGLINPGFFGLFPKMNRSAVERLAESLQKNFLPKLTPVVERILDDGWKHLEKYDYNLIVVFKRLLDEISKTNFHLKKNDKGYATRFFSLESAFLFFYARSDHINKLLSALDTALTAENTSDRERNESLAYARLVLQGNVTKPCLHDFIIAVSMFASRRALGLSDLVNRDSALLVSTEEFDCSTAVQREIDALIEELVNKLEPLTADRDTMDSSTHFIPYDENDELDLSPVSALLGQNIRVIDKKTDLRKLAALIIDGFLEAFGANLEKPLETFSQKNVRMVPEHALEYELGRLRDARFALEKTAEPVYYARYKAIKSAGAPPNQAEEDACGGIAEIAAVFRLIGSKLSTYLYTLLVERSLLADDEDNEAFNPVSPLDELLSDPVSTGQTMGDRGAAAARFAFSISGYFLNPEILALIQSKHLVKEEIRVTMFILERLALAEEYEAVKDRFGLGHFTSYSG